MAEPRVLVESRGAVLLIGLNRPAKRNAADLAMLHELSRAFTLLHADEELRVGVVYGVGEHTTGGLDLADVGPTLIGNPERLLPERGIDPWGVLTEQVAKPVLMAVQGACLTLGTELALAADIVIAAENSSFAQLEVVRGLIAFGGATVRLPRLGWGDAMRWLLSGERFDAAEAHRIGLVQEVVPDGAQLTRALELAERIASLDPTAVQATLASARLALTDPQAAFGSLHQTASMLAGRQLT